MDVAVYGYGTIAVFFISVVSLCGLLIVKFRRSAAYNYIINTMLGMGVGTLVGDAFLHLIPHVRIAVRLSVLTCSNSKRCYQSVFVVL